MKDEGNNIQDNKMKSVNQYGWDGVFQVESQEAFAGFINRIIAGLYNVAGAEARMVESDIKRCLNIYLGRDMQSGFGFATWFLGESSPEAESRRQEAFETLSRDLIPEAVDILGKSQGFEFTSLYTMNTDPSPM